MHIVDFYFPNKPRRPHQRMNFYKVCRAMDWDTGDPAMCPGSPTFDFKKARKRINFIRPQVKAARIAIGDSFCGSL